MIPVRTTLRLLPPGVAPDSELLPLLESALRTGAMVRYLVPDASVRRRRMLTLEGRVSIWDPPVVTLRELALRALAAAGEAAAPPRDPAVVEGLVEKVLARVLLRVPRGPGRAAVARRGLASLLEAGWSAEALWRGLARLEERNPEIDALEPAWRAFDALCPGLDTERPLRRVLEAGHFSAIAPHLLLIEGGPLRRDLHARLIADLVARVHARGGAVVATCLDLPAVTGPRARLARLLREILGGEIVDAVDLAR